ncbi:MAG: CHRD domain-containing protein, partial [Gemmataceae bacterium]|nr:CHRD domain-containing protein [Gemmataceae bacterium]
MTVRFAGIGLVGVAVLLAGAAGPARAGFTATTELLGDNQVPPVVTTGFGSAAVVYDDVAGTLSVDLAYADLLGTPAAAHIHVGAKDANGPVVIEFDGFPTTTSGVYSNVFTDADLTGAGGITTLAELAGQIAAGNTYINIHTSFSPRGEIRGQLAAAVPAPPAVVLA